ncbi:MAG: PKD domain-containing protein [Bacteroidia bacterium]|nr:PKD domain-containing protein [Bacteroidia bacterium]
MVQIVDSSVGVAQYAWDFGDPASMDNFSSEKNPQHIFTQPGKYDITLTATLGDLYSNHVIKDTMEVVIPSLAFEQTYNTYNGIATDIVELSNPEGGFLIVGYGGQAFQVDKKGVVNTAFDDWPDASGNTSQNPQANFYHVIELESGLFVAAENVPETFLQKSSGGIVLINQNGSLNDRKLLSDLDPRLENADITDLMNGKDGRFYLTGTYYSTSADTGGIFLMKGENLQDPELLTTYFSPGAGRFTGGQIAIDPQGKLYISGLNPEGRPLLFEWEESYGKDSMVLVIDPANSSFIGKILPIDFGTGGDLIALIGFKEIELRKVNIGLDGRLSGVPNLVETRSQGYDKVLSMDIISTRDNGYAGVALLYDEQELDNATGLYEIKDQNNNLTGVNTGGKTTTDHFFSIVQTRDEGFVIVGSRNGKFFFKKIK